MSQLLRGCVLLPLLCAFGCAEQPLGAAPEGDLTWASDPPVRELAVAEGPSVREDAEAGVLSARDENSEPDLPPVAGGLAAEPFVASNDAPAPPKPERVDFTEALERELVDAEIRGRGLSSIEVTLQLKVDAPIEVVIPAGMLFDSDDSKKQDMVTRHETVVSLEVGAEVEVTVAIPAACAEMELDTPGPADSFSQVGHRSPLLARLISTAEFSNAPSRVQQFAIWTITDNPSRGGYTGIGPFGFGSGPSDSELAHIRKMLEQAGIDPMTYAAFKPNVVPRTSSVREQEEADRIRNEAEDEERRRKEADDRAAEFAEIDKEARPRLDAILAEAGDLKDTKALEAIIARLTEFQGDHPGTPSAERARRESKALSILRLGYLWAERTGNDAKPRLRNLLKNHPGTIAAEAAARSLEGR